MAYAFGGGAEIAGFMVAFRFANLFRRLLGEGVLQTGFIPVYEQLKVDGARKGALLYRDAVWSVGVVALAMVIGAVFVLQMVGQFLNPSWKEIADLTAVMLPSLFWISLFGLDAAVLQAEKKTFWAGVAPALFNFGMLGFAFVAMGSSNSMRMLSIGVVCSFALQWMLASWQARESWREALNIREWLSPQLFSVDVRRMLGAVGLGVVGIGATQLNSALDAIFARISDPSGPAYLWYAIRLYQLPLALVGIALSSALLPSLVRRNLEGEVEAKDLLQGVVEKGMELILICAFALIAFAQSGVNLLFGHGHFGPHEVEQTVFCLWAYGIGFVPSALVLLFAQSYYAKRTFAAPVKASLISVAFHVCLNILLVFGFHLGAVSVALSTSSGALLNCYLLSDRGWKFPTKAFWIGAVATGLCLVSDRFFGAPRDWLHQCAHLATNSLLFGVPAGACLIYFLPKRQETGKRK